MFIPLFMATALMVHVATYWVVAWPTLRAHCATPHDSVTVAQTVVCVLQNQFLWTSLVAVPLLLLFPPAPFLTHSGTTIVLQFAGCIVLTDVFFYLLHRLFHSRCLFRFHARHHEWTSPEGFAAFDAHPAEHVFVNVLPVLAAALVTRCDWYMVCVWVAFATGMSVSAHAQEGPHALHHERRTVNYGVGLMLLDRALGTLAQTNLE
jgi:sterol desaturase/sphingolipid hydroxylase (fatty acid hydroxylase superfamily)